MITITNENGSRVYPKHGDTPVEFPSAAEAGRYVTGELKRSIKKGTAPPVDDPPAVTTEAPRVFKKGDVVVWVSGGVEMFTPQPIHRIKEGHAFFRDTETFKGSSTGIPVGELELKEAT